MHFDLVTVRFSFQYRSTVLYSIVHVVETTARFAQQKTNKKLLTYSICILIFAFKIHMNIF